MEFAKRFCTIINDCFHSKRLKKKKSPSMSSYCKSPQRESSLSSHFKRSEEEEEEVAVEQQLTQPNKQDGDEELDEYASDDSDSDDYGRPRIPYSSAVFGIRQHLVGQDLKYNEEDSDSDSDSSTEVGYCYYAHGTKTRLPRSVRHIQDGSWVKANDRGVSVIWDPRMIETSVSSL